MALQMFKEKARTAFPGVGHVLAIAAGKGGVGKSTVTVNCALALRKKGCQVGILDADLYGPSIRRMLPEDRLPSKKGEKLIPAVCSGISVMTMAYFKDDGEASSVRAPIANSVVSQFIEQVDWGRLDYLLIDFPPGTGDIQLTLAQKASLTGAIMVTTPQEVALLDVRKAIQMFEQVQIPVIGVIENMSYYQPTPEADRVALFGAGGGERLAREMGLPLLGQIPVEPELGRCADAGESLFMKAPENSATSAFTEATELAVEHVKALAEDQQGVLKSFDLAWERS